MNENMVQIETKNGLNVLSHYTVDCNIWAPVIFNVSKKKCRCITYFELQISYLLATTYRERYVVDYRMETQIPSPSYARLQHRKSL